MGKYSIQIDKGLFGEMVSYFLIDDDDTDPYEHYRRYLKIRRRLQDVHERAVAHDDYSRRHTGTRRHTGGGVPDEMPDD